ncbi:HAMP domain-containing histidine kinase [Blastococcus sp. MG754426]|uniref:sensor histidine kinase n=1 Tax=unclassified Blastococcus TaxID=2619396 RepID=UPI001EF0A2F9|nr:MULTISPECIES: HAMP domain-containing sensor histidine kinase [unclassified Blastococcus]MCF6509049.1 HAMP domain-containing histidine kinase [Blastococcus sp. MG754426]MCF6512182.1 HAMP domain-containing histidine kinase [Blastococcus sp. MG754427]
MTPPPAPVRGPRVPLRVTLVALLVALLSAALLATGLATTSLLRDYLQDQRDAELRILVEYNLRPEVAAACRQPGDAAPNPFFVACLPPGSDEPVVLGEPQGPGGDEMPELSGKAVERLRADSRPFTVWVDGERWRMTSGQLPGGYTLVVGDDNSGVERAIARLVRIELVVGLSLLVVLGAAGYVLVRNSLRPLVDVERTAAAIAAGDLSRRVPVGDERTEVGRLSTALNGMLARIETAFRAQQASEEQARGSEHRMRRFVADASHELRTPLTSIRGFAELYRQGAVRSDEDVARLMQRIEAEGGRMGLLVEDLLLLARMDQQRPLSVAPVDLAAVAGDAVHDARAVQPDRPISLHLDESLTDVPVVLGDESRLRQVVGNLVTNALTHTPPSTRVLVSVAEAPDDPDVLLLRVADEGPGMDPADAERAFERFYRADASRTRAAGGTGLGLSIVASLAAAHGGSASLETVPGEGLAVTVQLPRSGPPGGGAPAA